MSVDWRLSLEPKSILGSFDVIFLGGEFGKTTVTKEAMTLSDQLELPTNDIKINFGIFPFFRHFVAKILSFFYEKVSTLIEF